MVAVAGAGWWAWDVQSNSVSGGELRASFPAISDPRWTCDSNAESDSYLYSCYLIPDGGSGPTVNYVAFREPMSMDETIDQMQQAHREAQRQDQSPLERSVAGSEARSAASPPRLLDLTCCGAWDCSRRSGGRITLPTMSRRSSRWRWPCRTDGGSRRLRSQLVGRRPVKHRTYGAVVEGPDRTVVAIALGGVEALQAIASAVPGPVATSLQWAPPPIVPSSPDFRAPWAALTESTEEEAARAAAMSLLPDGAVMSPADQERFGPLTVVGVTAHLPDHTGIAGFGLDPTSAFSALAARLRGELQVTDVWFPET